MSDADALLAGIAADPDAALPRLVYADWLDDRGDPRGELVRLEQHLHARPADDAALVRFRTLAAGCDPVRLAAVVRPAVARCGLRFAFACEKEWTELEPTADPAVRQCAGYAQPVHLTVTRVEAHRRAAAGECVAVDFRLVDPAGVRRATAEETMLAGVLLPPAPPPPLVPERPWDRFRRWLGRR